MANSIISPDSKIKVHWDDLPHNYTKEAKIKIRNYFASKYGVSKNNITVVYRPVRLNDKGEYVEITGAGIENIMDIQYQRSLMKQYLASENKTVDFDRIINLDTKVNGELNLDVSLVIHRHWALKWVMVDNFLSFGENNYMPLSKLRGLTVVNSIPANQGGKTTLTIDAIKYLLHGTTTKTDTNEQIFNSFSDKNELTVRGMIEIESEEIIIERKMKRVAKKDTTWNVTNKVNYYRILPDGEEEALNEEDAKETTKKIKENVGTEKDFEMLVLATEKNLEDLIGLTTTESGKILTRLIGLEILELKEGVARTMHNDFLKNKKSKGFDVITLSTEIEEHKENIIKNEELQTKLVKDLEDAKAEINTAVNAKEALINSKEKIDVTISSMNPSKLEAEIKEIGAEGKEKNDEVTNKKQQILAMGVIKFDEDRHHSLTKTLNVKNTEKALKEADIKRLRQVVENLIAGGICQSCNRKLDNVDNTAHIEAHKKEVLSITKELLKVETDIKDLGSEIDKLNEIKKVSDAKHSLEINVERLEVNVGKLRNEYQQKMNDLKKYKLNLEAIELNKTIDMQIEKIKTDINVSEYNKEQAIINSNKVQAILSGLRTEIENKTKLIDTIKKEEEIDKIFKIYIDLVGKKGISKIVLRSVLPIINAEVQRLLEDIVDFEIEIFIDDKNNVKFLINKDGVTKLLKSGSGLEKTAASLALRCVLGKVSMLPMPNFITFDEVLGKVAPENLEKLKSLFDKIKDMYEIVFFITHNDVVKDWGDNVVTVTKSKNNISSVSIK